MNIQNPPFRLVIYSLAAAFGTYLLLWTGLTGFISAKFVTPFLLFSFGLLLGAQYLTSYLLEEFMMEVKENQQSRWLSAPLGILFSYLTYSIISLSLGLLI